MNILSTIYRVSLIILALAFSAASAADRSWPVKGEIDLSSTFCDYRPLHFHGGIDIRTGGKEGRSVYSPVDGYIWRIKYSYVGYGKGVYVKDSQGFIYVFGHLSKLSDRLEKKIKEIQYSRKRYYFDTEFSRGEIPVSGGELIAYSGQSGFGAPHIHFEIRNPQNMPLNPLTNGFPLSDNYSPDFKALALIYEDSASIFDNGRRRVVLQPSSDAAGSKYFLDAPVFIKGPFGLAIKAIDRIRNGGPRLNIKRARLFIDDYLYYDVEYEQYDYAQTAMVDLTYDYYMAVAEDERWQRLYKPLGDVFDGTKSLFENGGIFTGHTRFSIGKHNARIEIYDAAGNMSELNFEFIYYPFDKIFDIIRDSDSTFYLRGRPENKIIDIRKVMAVGIGGKQNERPLNPDGIKAIPPGDYLITVSARERDIKALKIGAIVNSDLIVTDYILPFKKSQNVQYEFYYSPVENGLLFNVTARPRYVLPPRIDITYEDGWVESIGTTAVGRGRFAAYYRKPGIKTKIIRLEVVDRHNDLTAASREVDIRVVDGLYHEKINLHHDALTVSIPESAVYAPSYFQVNTKSQTFEHSGSIIGDVYEIEPTTVPLAKNILLTMRVGDHVDKSKIGVYRLNSKGKWKWLNSNVQGDKISAESSLTGTFAVLKDKAAPRVMKIRPAKGKTVKSAFPEIRCKVDEELSGIHNDGNISVTLDGQWLIPEYDPETKILKTTPRTALKNGRHELVIIVSDRVGNERKVFSHFFVNKK